MAEYDIPEELKQANPEELCQRFAERFGGGQERVNKCLERIEESDRVDGELRVVAGVSQHKSTRFDVDVGDPETVEEANRRLQLARATDGEYWDVAEREIAEEDAEVRATERTVYVDGEVKHDYYE